VAVGNISCTLEKKMLLLLHAFVRHEPSLLIMNESWEYGVQNAKCRLNVPKGIMSLQLCHYTRAQVKTIDSRTSDKKVCTLPIAGRA
jgi:hypothetical protein